MYPLLKRITVTGIFFLSICSIVIAQTYKRPVFTDAGRLKKIEESYGIIDKIYKDYAEQNHFPGLVYGIIVDGKLVHAGGVGYTQIDSKTDASTGSAIRIA